MSEWISVEYQKPDAEKEVRLFCVTSSGYNYQCQGFYKPPGTCREDSDYSWDWELCEEYNEERDDYMVNPGWYETIHNWDDYSAVGISDKVTHWMPLPEPPEKRLGGEGVKGSGCYNCPLNGCTAAYRGSRCSHLRDIAGVNFDPETNADRIRAMSDDELSKFLGKIYNIGTYAADRRDDFIWDVKWLRSVYREDTGL